MDKKNKTKTGIKRKNDDTGDGEKKQKIMVNRKHVEDKEKVEVVNQVVEVPVKIVHTGQLVEGNYGGESEEEGANFVQSNTEVTMQQVEEQQNTYQQFELSSGTQVDGQQEYEVAISVNPPKKTTKRYVSQNRRDRIVCRDLNEANSPSNMSATFKRRPGTAGIRGHFYETKLISLILYRAKQDASIEQFQLASNMDSKEAGDLDDICFKAEVKEHSKPLIAFIQTKHKDNSEASPEVVLMKYFLSYLKIREQFKSRHDERSMFYRKFQDTECYFVIYTNGKEKHLLDDDTIGNENYSAKLNDLIDTGGIAKRPYKNKANEAAKLYEKLAEDNTVSLAKRLATFMGKEMRFQDLLSDKNNIILLYHVFLGQKVFDVSEIKESNKIKHRVATFRKDFFNNEEKYLTKFKKTLFQEIFKRRKMTIKAEKMVEKFISEFKKKSIATSLSKLIGTVVTYNEGELKLVEEYSKHFNNNMIEVLNKPQTVNKAVKLAAEDIITKVPAAFGNKDLTLRESDAKKEPTIKHLKSKIIDILDKSKQGNVVVIDKSVEEDILELNGGLAGAIGNIFVPDDNTKYMKISDSYESLGPLAKSLYTQLVESLEEKKLHEYRFDFDVKNVPRFSLGPSDYDKSLAREFSNIFLFYSKQATEKEVEDIIKTKIDDYYHNRPNYFRVKTDAVFREYHHRIQEWWMEPHQASYLTKDSKIFEEATDSIIEDPLMSSLNIIYISNIQHFDYTFHEDAVSSLHLQDHSATVIFTENCVLTVVKVLQHFKNKNHAVLDLEYIVNLPIKDRNALCAELKETSEHKALVFVCDKLTNKSDEITFCKIISEVLNTRTIFITNPKTYENKLKQYFSSKVSIVQDDKNSMIDMSESSQKSIFKSTVVFQGAEVQLNLILDDVSKAYVKGDVLNTIISKETITISKLTVDRQYDEVKHLYVDRCVQKKNSEKSLPIKTLFDIRDDVVLVTAEPGMGKSTLLTHLSLETKKYHQHVWIVRVNLLEYSREFSKWKQEKTAINTLETIKFMCQVMLGEKQDGTRNNLKFELEEDNGVVNLTQCTGDQLTEFELKLFLHFYNRRNIIFVIDGCDEICPDYKDEVIKCIKTVNSHPNKHRIWVTSRQYNEIIKCLQQAFGEPYEIEHLSYPAKKEYLIKIWKSNLILNKLNELQLKNVDEFIQFMIELKDQDLQACQSLLDIYIDAANYIINEWTFNDNYNNKDFKGKLKISEHSVFKPMIDNNPLNIFLRAHFFINRIKNGRQNTNTWNRDENMFTFYEHYLEMILKRWFEGKNKMDIELPNNKKAYKRKLVAFKAKHKKMAAYAIFNQHINELFSEEDIDEIKKTIEFIENGEENTGLICSVANNIPIFTHKTFAEYFAVEYICDLLKHDDESKKQHQSVDCIFYVMLSTCNFRNIRTIFDNKMKIDEKLTSVIENHVEVIFHLLIEKGNALLKYVLFNPEYPSSKIKKPAHFWPLYEVPDENLVKLRSLYLPIFERSINENNLDVFLKIVVVTRLLAKAVRDSWDDLVVCVINKIKRYDISRLDNVLLMHFGIVSHSFSGNYDEINSEEIIELIRKKY